MNGRAALDTDPTKAASGSDGWIGVARGDVGRSAVEVLAVLRPLDGSVVHGASPAADDPERAAHASTQQLQMTHKRQNVNVQFAAMAADELVTAEMRGEVTH